MNYYNMSGQLDLSDRVAVETGICRGESFRTIAKRLHRHPSTISHEIRENRTFIRGQYPAGKDCRYARKCTEKQLCGAASHACRTKCKYCRGMDCTKICKRYVSSACHRFEEPPYVCNTCDRKRICIKDKYIYSAKYADAASNRRRSESRQGFRITEKQFEEMDALITRLVKKGQPLTHIYAEHQQELPVGLRSLYNYIDSGKMTIKNIDLRRKTSYRQRRKNKKGVSTFGRGFREGRSYEDYEKELKFHGEYEVTEMDTVRGRRERGKRLLTMILRRYSIMLLFLMPDGKSESVLRVFDYLETGLGIESFSRLFPIILTDNGTEFTKAEEMEYSETLERRTRIFYCDPYASWQKPHIEKNHEYIRYVLPRGKSLDPYTQEDMTLLMNHINSTRRLSLGKKAPYELIMEEDKDMWKLWSLLKMDLIPPDEVHLKPDLFTYNK